ncbi:TIGR00374 family protein, partial [Streptomyces sp. NPDC059233]
MIRDQEETDVTTKEQGVSPPNGAATDGDARPDDGDGESHSTHDRARHDDTTRRPDSPGDGPAQHGGTPEDRAPEETPPGDGPHGHAPTAADQVEVDEPLLAARVHRPSDLVRLLVGILGIAVVLGISAFAHGTTAGLEADINQGTGAAPDLLIKVAALVSSIAVLLLPVAFAIERLIKRDGLRIADGVLAAVLAHGVTLATDLWVSQAAPETIQDALTIPAGTAGDLTDPVHGYLAPVIAYMTAVGMTRRPRWRVALWVVLLLDAFTMLVSGYTTPFSIILTVLIGWTVAYGTLYAVGSPNVRPTGQNLLAGLRRVGFQPVSAMRAEQQTEGGPDASETGDRGRRYHVTLEDGPPLDVTVVDREQQAQGFFYRVWRRLTLRGITTRRSLQSLRQALEQEALLAYAAIAAGANAPKLIATSELGPDAVMLVYEHLDGRTLDSLPDEEITDELTHNTWKQVRALQSRRIAHRRLTGDALVVDRSGNVVLTDLRGGEIAAGDLVLRMDVAQLLTTLGLRVGAERSVASAVSVLGPDTVADCLPLLQPIALSRSTRATLRRLARERADREREAVLES